MSIFYAKAHCRVKASPRGHFLADGSKLYAERNAVGPLDESARNASVRIWHENDMRSLLHIAPRCVQEAMARIPDELKLLTDGELRKKMKLTPVDNQLRLSFWLEYERVQAKMLPRMETYQICRGICGEDYFTARYLIQDLRVAWLITPPTSYVAKLSEAVDFGLERVREILELDIVDPSSGKVNSAVAKLILQATMLLDARKHGAVVQKIETSNKSMSVSVHAGAEEVQAAVEQMNMEQLEEKLQALERQEIHRIREARRVIDVTPDPASGTMSQEEWDAIDTSGAGKDAQPLTAEGTANQGEGSDGQGSPDDSGVG